MQNHFKRGINMIKAKPIVDGKFWLVEDNGVKLGILKQTEQKKYMLSSDGSTRTFDNKKKITEVFGKDFFQSVDNAKFTASSDLEIYGYPCGTTPYNSLFHVKKNLPLFAKSEKSKSLYCAGYYIIKFDKGWVKSFCPKLITVERYPYKGPFKTDTEMRQELVNASRKD